jgi:hypothetical protein
MRANDLLQTLVWLLGVLIEVVVASAALRTSSCEQAIGVERCFSAVQFISRTLLFGYLPDSSRVTNH